MFIFSEHDDSNFDLSSAANAFHSTTLGENSNAVDPSYHPTESLLESTEVNEEEGPSSLHLNHQYNRVDTGMSKDNIVLPTRSKEKSGRIRHYCILCKDEQENQSHKISKDRRQANITRHWNEVHSRHRRVREINSATSKGEKNRLIKLLRTEGDQYFNNTLAEKEGSFHFQLASS